MFTTGRIVFTIVFVLLFVTGLIWSYRKDSKVSQIHFKKPWRVLVALILFMSLLFLIVKIRKFL